MGPSTDQPPRLASAEQSCVIPAAYRRGPGNAPTQLIDAEPAPNLSPASFAKGRQSRRGRSDRGILLGSTDFAVRRARSQAFDVSTTGVATPLSMPAGGVLGARTAGVVQLLPPRVDHQLEILTVLAAQGVAHARQVSRSPIGPSRSDLRRAPHRNAGGDGRDSPLVPDGSPR